MKGTDSLTLRGHIVDLVARQMIDGEIVIADGRIAAIRPCDVPEDAPYYMPGWIDAHVHIESSMMLPREFARIARRHGTIGAIADPHEIANVLGIRGVELMLDDARDVNFYFGFGAPSCVPSCTSDIETSGAVLDSRAVADLLRRDDICALAEMMNFPGVLGEDPEVMAKIAAAKAVGKPIDGHAPGLVGKERERYAQAGISTDHECSTIEEARDTVRAGMHVLIRQGSAAKNLRDIQAIIAEAPKQVMFATDDSHPNDFLQEHIDRHIRRALWHGHSLMDVLTAASLNPIRHYHLPCGLLQVGDPADLIAISDTTCEFRVLATYIRGVECSHEDFDTEQALTPEPWMNICCAKPITVADLQAPAYLTEKDGSVHQIVAADRSLLTEHYVGPLDDETQKIVAYCRYNDTSVPRVGYIRGFGMKRGAFAQTIAHDCHNIVAIGADDESLVRVINRVISMGGGIVATDGEQMSELALPIAGLISPLPAEELAEANLRLEQIVARCGCTMKAPFITLGFMALPVIPQIKLTDKGLFNAAIWHMME